MTLVVDEGPLWLYFSSMNTIIRQAIDQLGSQEALAKACGVSQAAVSKWARGGKVSAESAVAIHRATHGHIALFDLRPDLWPAPQEAA